MAKYRHYRSPQERAINHKLVEKIDHSTEMIKASQRHLEYKERTCDAILLQFERPLIYDLYIPSPENIYSFMIIAGKKMNGEKINSAEVWDILDAGDLYGDFLNERHFSKLSKKVSKGILDLWSASDGFSLREYLKIKTIFANEWIMDYGNLYRFRDGEREKAEQRVAGHFTKEQSSDFDKIGKIIQPYIEQFFL